MSYSNAKRRRIKPFARPTSFDINVAYDIRHYQRIKYGNVIDPYFPAVGTDEAFKVLEGEVLMQTNDPDVRRYGDHQMHVFSFANCQFEVAFSFGLSRKRHTTRPTLEF